MQQCECACSYRIALVHQLHVHVKRDGYNYYQNKDVFTQQAYAAMRLLILVAGCFLNYFEEKVLFTSAVLMAHKRCSPTI